jgi:hypothetical protein
VQVVVFETVIVLEPKGAVSEVAQVYVDSCDDAVGVAVFYGSTLH